MLGDPIPLIHPEDIGDEMAAEGVAPLPAFREAPAEPDRQACLALAMCDGFGPRTMRRLLVLKEFGYSARAILRADPDHLQRLGVRPHIARAVQEAADRELPKQEFVCILDPDYPHLLRRIQDPPIALFFRGRRPVEARRVAIVGSRKSTPAGREVAAEIARGLSEAGVEVVSGLALGIDGAAHRGALEGGFGTTAVLGGGVDRVFPSLHRELASRIEANGTLLSEYPPGTPSLGGHFVRRNRIIAGLCLATILVDAKKKGGAMLTAMYAYEKGRRVMAVPGPPRNPVCQGSNGLLANGAPAVLSAADVLPHLMDAPVPDPDEAPEPAPREAGPAGALLPYLSLQPKSIDEICDDADYDVSGVLVLLMDLQMRGIVEEMPGRRYRIVPEDAGVELGRPPAARD